MPIDVQVVEENVSNYTLSFASVEFTPENAGTQTCRLGNGLQPFTPCRFWVDSIDSTVGQFKLPQATIAASKPGYVTERRVETLQGVARERCNPYEIFFTLRRAP